MKKVFLFLTTMLFGSLLFAVRPQGGISHQAVIRNSLNEVVTNSMIGVRVSILQGSESGTLVYQETHTPVSNANGLITYIIGQGSVETGQFDTIDWSNEPYFLQTEADPAGGTSYTITGTTQLLSVPYALYANTAGTLEGGINETDPIFGASVSNSITAIDTANWNNKLSSCTESQNLAQVAANGNSANTQLKNVTDPTDDQDAATKAYVDELLNIIQTLQIGVNDVDGNHYKTVIIGTQVWMAENLKTTKYNDGTDIPNVTDNTAWDTINTPAYCWYDNDSATYANTYGPFYNWHTVNTGKLCPTGWHVPSDAEWTTMENYLISNGFNYDGTTTGNKIAKSIASTTYWDVSSNIGAVGNTDYPSKRNVTGFTAFPGGYRNTNGISYFVGEHSYWWSSNEILTYDAYYRLLFYDYNYLIREHFPKECGCYVRCLKD